MTESGHTPGPWDMRQLHTDDSWLVFEKETGQSVARVAERWKQPEEGPNARLIAAAPDLLEACKEAFTDLATEYGSTNTTHWPGLAMDAGEELKAAIAKAKEAQ